MGLARSEIDDGLALLMLLALDEVEIVGVTTTFGNGSEQDVFRCTQQLLISAGRADIPIRRGAAHAGDRNTEAARFICDAARTHTGRLVLLAIGPMTNLAAALQADPTLPSRLDHVHAMGGYLRRLRFLRREVHELNLSCDARAADEVLHSRLPLTLMSAQICLQARYGVRHLISEWVRAPRLRKTIGQWFLAFSVYCGVIGFYLWDLVPAWAVVEPGRFAHRKVRLLSGAADLEHGTLRVADVPGAPLENEGVRSPGVINLPSRILRRYRFAGHCARRWRRVPLQPFSQPRK